ncbi:hypothetical protein V1511DRAFT_495211 [Dipodascopsis uninucleata]
MPSLISSADKEKIKRAVPKSTNKVIESAVARLYIAYPDPNAWTFTGVSGAVVLVNDLTGNTFFFKIVDIIGNRGVIWDQELYIDFQYNQDRAFFHTFELEECYAGLLFADDSEAHHFLKRVQQRDKHASKATLNNKNAIALKKSPSAAVAGPRGDVLRYQKMGNNYTLAQIHTEESEPNTERKSSEADDEDIDPSWKKLFSQLEEMGISEEMIANNADFIKDYITKGELPPSRSSTIDKKSKGPPPPPPLQPPTSRSSAPLRNNVPPPFNRDNSSYSNSGSSSPVGAGTPPPPPPKSPPPPAGPMYKVPPPFIPPAGAPVGRSSSQLSQSPASPGSGSDSVTPVVERRTPAPGHKYSLPPPFPGVGSNVTSVRPPSASPLSPPPSFGNPTVTGRAPPPLPARENSPGNVMPLPQNIANRPVPQPPSLPPRGPVQNGLAPTFGAPPMSGRAVPPPPPPHRHAYSASSKPSTPAYQPVSSPGPPPPPHPPGYGNGATSSRPTAPMQSFAQPPPPPPPPPSYGQSQQRPAVNGFGMPSNGPPPPPPPPLSYSSSPLSNTATNGGPPPPPPPPPSFGSAMDTNDFATAPTAAPDTNIDGRDALMASIRGAGLGQLKKVDKTHLNQPLVVSTGNGPSKSSTPAPDSSGPGGSLQDAISAALNKRKTRVAGSDDEDEGRDEW